MNKEIYFRGLKKGERRGLGVIWLLIEKDLPQQELLRGINGIIDEKIDDKTLSNTLKDLEKNEIIKKETIIKKGSWPPHNLVFIPKDYHTLVKIMGYLYSRNDAPFLLNLKRHFINSNYAKKVINFDLVKEIESKLENILQNKHSNIEFVFNEKEKQLILNILQSSPSALHYAINLSDEDLNKILDYKTWELLKEVINKNVFEEMLSKELKNKLKDRFMFNLQAYLSEDISKIGSPEPIEYITSIKFLQKEIDEKNYIYAPNINSSIIIEEDMIKNTLNTHIITEHPIKTLNKLKDTTTIDKIHTRRK
ncbi:MAG: hypothetical protein ACPK7O_06815 [Methanobacterium sp.]